MSADGSTRVTRRAARLLYSGRVFGGRTQPMAESSESHVRRFTYTEAKALLPQVRSLTEQAHAVVESLQQKLVARPEDVALRQRLESEVRAWAQRLGELGLVIKSLWLVDFDNGAGYYCWRWPEADLAFFHSYEEGFSGRVRIH